jgi:hypothetical protein
LIFGFETDGAEQGFEVGERTLRRFARPYKNVRDGSGLNGHGFAAIGGSACDAEVALEVRQRSFHGNQTV